MMNHWQQQRQIFLAIALAGVCFTIGRFSFDPTAGKRLLPSYTFPQAVPLPGWQLQKSHSLTQPPDSAANTYEAVVAGQQYFYQSHTQQLKIEMRYTGNSFGEVDDYLNRYTAVKLPVSRLLQNLRQQQGAGFYILFVYQGRSHLAACINPRGGSTVTAAQFFANRHTYDLKWYRLFPWLLGRESLLDKRCLWTDLSIPSSQHAATTLEQVWLSWYQWWSNRLPPG